MSDLMNLYEIELEMLREMVKINDYKFINKEIDCLEWQEKEEYLNQEIIKVENEMEMDISIYC